MKKYLLIMTLALLGGGTQINAAIVTKRVVAVNEITSWTGWSDRINIHVFGPGSITDWDTQMEWIADYDGKKIYYYDITADEDYFTADNFTIWIYNETRRKSDQGDNNKYHMVEIKGAYSTEQIFYLYDGGEVKSSPVNLTYYFVTTDGKTKLADLTNINGVLTGTYSSVNSGYGTIAANWALKDAWGGFRFDNYSKSTISPVGGSDIEVNSFTNFTGALGGDKAFYFTFNCTYDLSFDVFNKTFTVTPYFERTLPAAAEGYATFSSSYNVIPDPNLESVKYASAINTSTGKITWEDFDGTGIHSSDGALLKGTADETYKFTPATSASAKETNYLKPIANGPDANSDDKLDQTGSGTMNYILTKTTTTNTNAELCFYLVNDAGSKCADGTAYLEVPIGVGSREFFPIIWNESASVEGIEMESQNKNLSVYDLQGRRVNNPKKGLYIVNGKKVAIK